MPLLDEDEQAKVIEGIIKDACRDTGYTYQEAARAILSYFREYMREHPSSTDPVEE